eukprot:scaffold71545_cov90-Phaeocystis_antarctica.AAC.1
MAPAMSRTPASTQPSDDGDGRPASARFPFINHSSPAASLWPKCRLWPLPAANAPGTPAQT